MTTTIYNWYTYNRHREKLRELRENSFSSYMTHLFDNYQTTLFIISSNCLFCGKSDKNYGDKDVYELILVWCLTSNRCPHCLGGMWHKEIINGPIISLQEFNIFKTSMLWMMFTTFTKKNTASIPVWCWHEKIKDLNPDSILVPMNRRFMGWYDI